MGRRRRRIIKTVKRRLPTVFDCPKCGEKSIRVNLMKESKKAIVQCGNCKLKDEFQTSPYLEEIDTYCKFIDSFSKSIKTKI